MNIKQVPAHSSNYTHRSTKKRGIVFHWIVGESADATFRNPGRDASAHYSVLSNGAIHQHVRDDLVAWHAGPRANPYYIGIEHAGGQSLPNGGRKHPTAQCHEASAQLCAYLSRKHGLGRLVLGKNAFRHKNFMNTQCSGSLDVNAIINRTNNILNKPTQKMDYKVYKQNNNLYVDITSGGFVGTIKVERISGPQKGSYIKGININRPNGGRGGALVVDMDPIQYKVIFPNNHKIYNNTPPTNNNIIDKVTKELAETKKKARELEDKLKKDAEKHAKELVENQRITKELIEEKEQERLLAIEKINKEYAFELNELESEIAEKDLEIDKLEEFAEIKIDDRQQLAIEIITETENETGVIKSKVKKWHEFVDLKVPSKTLRSILKYDIFVFIGQNAPRITIGLAALVTLLQTSELPTWIIAILILAINILIDLVGIGAKLIATTFGDRDGKIDNTDYEVLGNYVSTK